MRNFESRVKALERNIPGHEKLPEIWDLLPDGRYKGPDGRILNREQYEQKTKDNPVILDDVPAVSSHEV